MGNKKGEECPIHGKKECPTLEEANKNSSQNWKHLSDFILMERKVYEYETFFPEVRNPTRSEIQDALDKFYPGCNLLRFDKTTFQPSRFCSECWC